MASRKTHSERSSGQSVLMLLFCFFLSGTAGLIYQIAWTRALSLLFGHTTYAVATVLAIFLGGLALGSATLAKYGERSVNAVALYAWLELAIAAAGLLSFLGLAAVRAMYLSSAQTGSASSPFSLLIRILGAAIVLLPPTFLMGGTFPILICGVTRHLRELTRSISRFYASNTLGAAIGALVAGFLLLPTIGLRLTIVVAVLVNAIAGLVALKFSSRAAAPAGVPRASLPTQPPSTKSVPTGFGRSNALLLSAFVVVGATAISYEISWTRLLSTMLGSSTYAFTIMLATFLAGIAFGSLVFEKWSATHTVALSLFSDTQTITALASVFFLLLFGQLPGFIPPILESTGNSFAGLLLAQLTVSALAMFPAALVFGFNFPLVVALVAENRKDSSQPGQDVGRAYAANTSGAILAALLVGFILLPKIGSFRVVALTAIVNLLLAMFLAMRGRPRTVAVTAAQLVTLAVIAFLGFSSHFHDKALASFSAVLYGSYHQNRLTLQEIAGTEDVVFFKDGLNATISVTRSEDYVALKTNGKVDASTIDTSTQLLLGHLGAVFHPHPRRVLIIGFGGGMTASAIARYPDVETIDCVEIEPAVLDAANHLERLNRGVLRDRRLHIIYDDARNFVQTAREPYDLIISEPSNPWIAGVAALYTSEFYAAVRAHLAADGMFVQWVQAYGLQGADFRMILATLNPHFADVSLWRSADRDFLVLARAGRAPLNFDRSREFWTSSALQADFGALHLTQPEAWPVYFRLSDSGVRSLALGARINTDDLTRLEYSAPRSVLYDPLAQSLSGLIEQHENALLPPGLPEADRKIALLASAESAADLRSLRTKKYLEAVGPEADPQLMNVLSARVALLEHHPAEAIARLLKIPSDVTNLYKKDYWLAKAYLEAGQVAQAQSEIRAALAGNPGDEAALETGVEIYRASGDWVSAVAIEKRLLTAQPEPSAANYCALGDLELRAGDRASAERSLKAGLAVDSYSFLCHRDLGELERAAGKYEEARSDLEFVVKYFPEADAKTFASLALACKALGRRQDADDVLRKGRRIFPEDVFLQNFKLPN